MKFGHPVNANKVLLGNGKDIGDLYVVHTERTDGLDQYTSLWYPSESERLHILAGLPVQVHVVTSGSIPAIGVDVSTHTEAVTAGLET